MNKTFTKLAQKNLDHYNEHRAAHNAITLAYGAAVLVGVPKLIKRICNVDDRP
jgi:hypothetical protein